MLAIRTVLLLSLCLFGCTGSPGIRGGNVVLIVVDTLRADHVGAYGHPRDTTPAIDRLASRSLVVENAYAQAPWTKPSIASVLTSVRARTHGIDTEMLWDGLPESLPALPEILRDAGYRTAAVSENPHIRPEGGFGRGFEAFELNRGFSGNARWARETASRWLDSLPESSAFFLYVHFLDPHGPYDPERSLLRFVPTPARGLPRVGGPHSRFAARGNLQRLVRGEHAVPLAAGDVAQLAHRYDAELRGVDEQIGLLLAKLEELGRADSTIVMVTSDHGEELYEHGSLKHGYRLFEESLRIPLIVHVPGVSPRRESSTLVQHIDIAPTLLDLVGLPVPPSFQGRSVTPLLSGGDLPPRPILVETRWRSIDRRALRSGRYKLIVDLESGRRELYDLETDPGEENDLAGEREDVVAQLEGELARLEEATPALPEGQQATSDGSTEMDPELEGALRSLGYLEEP